MTPEAYMSRCKSFSDVLIGLAVAESNALLNHLKVRTSAASAFREALIYIMFTIYVHKDYGSHFHGQTMYLMDSEYSVPRDLQQAALILKRYTLQFG